MVEPEVQLEKFRKDHDPLVWKRFRFNANSPNLSDWDLSLVEKDHEEKIDDQSDSSSDSNSDTSSSSSEAEIPESTKPVQLQNDLGAMRKYSWVGQPISSMQFALIPLPNREHQLSKALRGDQCVGLG